MNRRGFALLTALWLVVALSGAAAGSLAAGRTAIAASRNRARLLRAAWARDACTDVMRRRLALNPARGETATVDLGAGVTCDVRIEHPGARLSLNDASAEMLVSVLGDSSLVDALLDWRDRDTVTRAHGAERAWYLAEGRRAPSDRDFAAVAELRHVRGFERLPAAFLDSLFTTRGDGRVDLARASRPVLAALPGVGPAGARQLRPDWVRKGAEGDVATRAQGLLGREPGGSELARLSTIGSPLVVLHVTGHVVGSRLVASAVVTVLLVEGRAAVVQRELL